MGNSCFRSGQHPGRIIRQQFTTIDIPEQQHPQPSAPPIQTQRQIQIEDNNPVYQEAPPRIPPRLRTPANPTYASAGPTSNPPPHPLSASAEGIDDEKVRKAAEKVNDRLLVAAIDFGTTYTGYAFSFRHEYEKNKLKISTNLWPHNNGLSTKAPTAVLIGQDENVMSFGYDALKQYGDMMEYGTHKDCYFFQRFKMALHTEQALSNDTMLTDVGGRQMKALTVFSKTIQYVKEHVLQKVGDTDTRMKLRPESVHWVLTVPAIWGDKAKQFMRRAAEKAGIEGRQLTLALEPEAAAVLCQYTPIYQETTENREQEFKAFDKGSKYMVVDLGGGTVDIAVHSINGDGALEEIHPATGGYWGGNTVDMEYSLLLSRIFGDEVLAKSRLEFPNDIIDMFQEFESKKRTFEPGQTSSVSFKLPASLMEIYQQMNGKTVAEGIQEMHDGVARIKRDKLSIPSSQIEKLFSRSVSNIVQHLKDLFAYSRVTSITTMLLVGGYSECHVVKDAIIAAFPHIHLVHPTDSSLAVLKGAVLFGHEPDIFKSRVCKNTYGIGMMKPFNPNVHPIEKLRTIKGVDLCDDVFDAHLYMGKQVSISKEPVGKVYHPPANQEYSVLDVYASTALQPKFVTEDSCTRLGSVVIKLTPDLPPSETLTVKIMYGGTELEVKARETTSRKTTHAFFDFLG